MIHSISKGLLGLAVAMLTSAAQATELSLSVEVPRIDVAEYHRPYVAMWLQREGSGDIHNIAVWYEVDNRDQKGEDWLKDMRQWWRRSGRSLDMPVDGLSGATRAPGVHPVALDGVAKHLEAGDYILNVEAAREVGDRELLSIPFTWPVADATRLTAQGDSELGLIELKLQP